MLKYITNCTIDQKPALAAIAAKLATRFTHEPGTNVFNYFIDGTSPNFVYLLCFLFFIMDYFILYLLLNDFLIFYSLFRH
ncbi:MAG: hypothetical protein EBQ56_01860 [Proteobacteria bacterium]|nr:hypothetical protein [Pseudomonadota bacterium]